MTILKNKKTFFFICNICFFTIISSDKVSKPSLIYTTITTITTPKKGNQERRKGIKNYQVLPGEKGMETLKRVFGNV